MGTFDESSDRLRLSALADGEAAGDGAAACATWRGDADARRDWHAWHLIGDVLRSEDLASDPRADLRFCAAVRARLAKEAVVLAPAAGLSATAPVGARRSGHWMYASAAAAGFVLVAATFSVLRSDDGAAPARIALADAGGAAASAARAPARSALAVETAAPQLATVADQRLIRDAQLDRYLVAHKQFAGISALGTPSVFLRSATVESPPR